MAAARYIASIREYPLRRDLTPDWVNRDPRDGSYGALN